MVHIKAYLCKYNGTVKEIRRITLNQDVSWANLSQVLQNLFTVHDFTLEYQDPENDMIVLGSTEEWEECLRIGASYADVGKPLRLYLRKAKPGRRERSSASLPSLLEPTHFYSTGESCIDTQYLQGVQATVPKLLADILPENWQSEPRKETLPEWLQPAVNVQWDKGEFELDVNVDILGSVLSRRALKLMDDKQYSEALALLKVAITVQPTSEKFYNIACCYSLLGDKEQAFEALNEALSKGYNNANHMKADSDLDNLKSDERFEELIAKLEGQADETEVESVAGSDCAPAVSSPSAPELTDEVEVVEAKPQPEPEVAHHEPVVEKPEPQQSELYPEQMKALRDMGFWDHKLSVRVLDAAKGHLPTALEMILSRSY